MNGFRRFGSLLAGILWTASAVCAGTGVPGDQDADGDVDLDDFALFAPCMTGPDNGPYPEGCDAFDFDRDLDVDLADLAGFQRAFGPPFPELPSVSQWGMVVISLLLVTGIAVKFSRRRHRPSA